MSMSTETCLIPTLPNPPGPANAPAAPQPARPTRAETIKTLVILLIATAVLSIVFAMSLGWEIPGITTTRANPTAHRPEPLKVELVKNPDDPKTPTHTLSVPEEVRTSLGIRKDGKDVVATATLPATNQTLSLPGSTALNPAGISRIRARFATNGTEVVSIGQTVETFAPTQDRELRPGDTVRAGDVLAVFYSVDVGSKKNDLIDAVVQLKLDQRVLDNMVKDPLALAAVPKVQVLTAEAAVARDHNAINRAVKNLETWTIPPEDIEAVRKEAEEISKNNGKRDPEKEKLWGQVVLKSPINGVIIERNITKKEIVVDNTINLFQIADVDRLLVLANAPEDELPRLRDLHRRGLLKWSVRTAGAPAATGLLGPVDEIGYLIDPNTHTAVLKGIIRNDGGALRAGQYVTAAVELPREEKVVEVPMAAVADDGRQCAVFVQPDPAKPEYTLRRVKVTHRFDKTAYVSSELTDEDVALGIKQHQESGLLPFSPLKEGDRVLTSGILELKKELEDRESTNGKK
ncbi:MAG: hypothetical protein JWO38_2173 [Gemmataceae bacterium]|nr:hypothetical protein [Gemmataceae bacterium]